MRPETHQPTCHASHDLVALRESRRSRQDDVDLAAASLNNVPATKELKGMFPAVGSDPMIVRLRSLSSGAFSIGTTRDFLPGVWRFDVDECSDGMMAPSGRNERRAMFWQACSPTSEVVFTLQSWWVRVNADDGLAGILTPQLNETPS